MEITFFKIEFMQFVNQNIDILGRKLYSPSLKNVVWLEDAHSVIFSDVFTAKHVRDVHLPSQLL